MIKCFDKYTNEGSRKHYTFRYIDSHLIYPSGGSKYIYMHIRVYGYVYMFMGSIVETLLDFSHIRVKAYLKVNVVCLSGKFLKFQATNWNHTFFYTIAWNNI